MSKGTGSPEKFAHEYIIDLNGQEAAKRAGYSEKSAHVTASRLLKNAKVQALIAQLTEKKFVKLDISAERILQELARLAFVDIRNLFDADGGLKPVAELDEDTARAIAGIDHEKLFEHFGKGQAKHVGTTAKIKLADKTRALQLLGQYQKLFAERIEVTGDEKLIAALAAGRKRLSNGKRS